MNGLIITSLNKVKTSRIENGANIGSRVIKPQLMWPCFWVRGILKKIIFWTSLWLNVKNENFEICVSSVLMLRWTKNIVFEEDGKLMLSF